MKYSIGDKVRIKSIDWYKQMLAIPNKSNEFLDICCGSYIFTREMCCFCGNVMTIKEVREDYYIMKEDIYNTKFTDEMLEDVVTAKFKIDDRVETNDGLFGYITEVKYNEKVDCYEYYVSFIVDGGYYYENQLKLHKKESDSIVPKFKVGDEIVKKDSISNSYLVSSVGSDYYGLTLPYPNNGVGVLPVKEQDEWELLKSEKVEKPSLINIIDLLNNEVNLPDGYEFRDGDGNLIAVDKIVLSKKRPKYPQTYEECCQYLGCDDKIQMQLIGQFTRLINARNAYWKIAGDEMGLGKSWEPDWEKLSTSTNLEYIIIQKGRFNYSSRVLVFPTAEMRDVFYEAFKDLIEECKELL